MRILGGKLKGKSLAFRADPDCRPTADKVRQAVFNVLAGFLDGKRVLDLYSGTGAFGLEALSQGALYADFVEQDGSRVRELKANVKRLQLQASAKIFQADALSFLKKQAKIGAAYDLIFLDPPYEAGLSGRTLRMLGEGGLTAEKALIVVEASIREDLPERILRLEKMRDKKYGQTRLAVYRFMPGGSGRDYPSKDP